MKIDNQVHEELTKTRRAIDNMYDLLNITLYRKNTGAKITYTEVNPSDLVTDNFEYISNIIKEIQNSKIIGDE